MLRIRVAPKLLRNERKDINYNNDISDLEKLAIWGQNGARNRLPRVKVCSQFLCLGKMSVRPNKWPVTPDSDVRGHPMQSFLFSCGSQNGPERCFATWEKTVLAFLNDFGHDGVSLMTYLHKQKYNDSDMFPTCCTTLFSQRNYPLRVHMPRARPAAYR